MRGVRTLCAASIGYCTAVFLSHYLLFGESLAAVLLLPVIIVLAAALFRGNMRTRLIIVAVAMAVGFGHYWLHNAQTVTRCEEYAGKELTTTARLTDYPDVRDRCVLLSVKITGAELPNVNALIIDYSNEEPDFVPGDEIKVKIKLRSVTERFGEETDSNISKGVYLSGYTSEKIEKTGRWAGSFLYWPKLIGNALHNEIGKLFPEDTAPFMKALLAGYKDDYYQNDKLYASMNVAGLAHVVAVSGMHVAFLVGVLQSILGKNRRSSLICIALVWLFVIMVGSPLSAVRAGIMISLPMLAPVFGRVNDRATTLSFALAMILLSNPFSAGSVALQLSFGSVVGMFLFSQPIYEFFGSKLRGPKVFKRPYRYIIATLSSSLAVTVFTCPLMAVHFGYVTLLAPIMNILCLWAISFLFVGGFALCIIGFVLPVPTMWLANILSYLVRYIAGVVEYSAKLPITALYMENKYAPLWLISSYVLFIAYFVIRRYKKLNVLIPTAVCAALLCGVFWLTDRDMRADQGTISVMNVGNGQCIAVTESENTVVIDCGSYGVTQNAGSMLASYLRANGRYDIDYLMLTHLHTDHATGVERLLNLMNVKAIIMPDNAEDTSGDGMLDEIIGAAEKNGTKIVYITQDTDFTAGDIRLSVYESSDFGARDESGIMSTVSVGDYDMLVTGDVEKVVERELVREHDLSGTELLIVPHHGSKYSTSDELLSAIRPETAVISTGYNKYGHPTQETLDILEKYNVNVLRTDKLGRVVLHISAGD